MHLKQYHFHPTAFSLGCDRSLRLLHCTQGGRERGKEEEKEEEEEEEEERLEVFACDVLKVRAEGGREGGREEGEGGETREEGKKGGRKGRKAFAFICSSSSPPLLLFISAGAVSGQCF